MSRARDKEKNLSPRHLHEPYVWVSLPGVLRLAQWLEHPTGLRKVIDTIPVARDTMITSFLISSQSLKFTIILYYITFDYLLSGP